MPERNVRAWIAAAAVALVVATLIALQAGPGADEDRSSPERADAALDQAIARLVGRPDGPPAVAVVVQRPDRLAFRARGTAAVGESAPPAIDAHMRVASVSKAFNGAAALALVADGALQLDDTIGATLPHLPRQWADVTLAQLLRHTSGVPDFSASPAFQSALGESLSQAPPPGELLAFVEDEPLAFRPGSRYRYSNSDNVIVGLMVEAASGSAYAEVLDREVYEPLGLTRTSLPPGTRLPRPFLHGYVVDPPDPPEDVSEVLAAGWAWAAGGVVSSPADLNRFIRAYASGSLTDPALHRRQLRGRPGGSEPLGPGRNAAGLGIYRYRTRCGTVYGHTGNTLGYTQLAAATRDGSRSVVVSATAQVVPREGPEGFRALRRVFEAGVCAALAR